MLFSVSIALFVAFDDFADFVAFKLFPLFAVLLLFFALFAFRSPFDDGLLLGVLGLPPSDDLDFEGTFNFGVATGSTSLFLQLRGYESRLLYQRRILLKTNEGM